MTMSDWGVQLLLLQEEQQLRWGNKSSSFYFIAAVRLAATSYPLSFGKLIAYTPGLTEA